MLPLDKEIIILDGGFSSQISRHVEIPVDGHVLWTSRFILSNKEAVVSTYFDFLKAGADIITTNTYQANIKCYMKHLNLTEKESYNLIKESVVLAKQAVELYKKQFPNDVSKRLIAGSVGPYGAALHDGSEYSGSYWSSVSIELLKEWHRPRIEALLDGGADLLAFETVPCKMEGIALVELLKEFPNARAWLSFSCKDSTTISNGDNFQEAARYCYDLNPEQIIAVGTNCLSPKYVEELFTDINKDRPESKKIPLIVYPNSGEVYSNEGWMGKATCIPLADFVDKWIKLGVKIIGGCCRTYAEDIAQIKEKVMLNINKNV